ncbi:tripartite tricarboxylate transporter TctB family protein [Lentzea indica]|uniref:tripartite tricarboxylate transporter TctB family protein n=1 Tax=Lentzea indica TaxID=2604800 RepID=UPI00143AAE41|nr:tripartite tricarboxylate transporter TctB family protein [Lentzea indica]
MTRFRSGEPVFGLVLVTLGVVALTQVWVIRGDWSVSGPRLVPLVVCTAWVLLAAVYVAQTVRSSAPGEGFDRTPLYLIATLIGYAYIVIPLGYIISTALSFVLTTRILGSRSLLRDVVIGVLLALALYLGFTSLLSIRLPRGVLPL